MAVARQRATAAQPVGHWVREEVYFEGDPFYFAMLSALRAAKSTIDVEAYIFECDELGRRLVDELEAAAARGVRVRLLVDGWGSHSFRRRTKRELESRGIAVRIFHPLHVFRVLNRRNHRKLCIIDGHVAFTGSRNVASVHCETFGMERFWRDTSARVEGVEVEELTRAFERSWKHFRNFLRAPRDRRLEARGPELPFRLNHSIRLRRRMHGELIRRLRAARRRIWITNAYFVPDGTVVRALRDAALAGVDVRVIVPGKSDVFFMPWVAAAFYRALGSAGVRIYEYVARVLHAKTLIIDDWCVVGSSNLNQRSLRHDLEADVVLSQPDSREALERQFLADLADCREVSATDWERKPWIQRFMAWIALFLRTFL